MHPRIHGELLKLGLDVSERTISRLLPRRSRPPSQTWRTFLQNHVGSLVAVDFLTVPTITCRLLFVLVVLAHDRRRILHVNVTAHPTSAWTRQQLREAVPWCVTARYLLHDRDAVFDAAVRDTVDAFGMTDVSTAPRSPWQNPYVPHLLSPVAHAPGAWEGRAALDSEHLHLRDSTTKRAQTLVGAVLATHSLRVPRGHLSGF